MAASAKAQCSLLPVCLHPLKDLATPEAATTQGAARMRKRKERGGDPPAPVSFPWNAASCALVAGAVHVPGSQLAHGQACVVCVWYFEFAGLHVWRSAHSNDAWACPKLLHSFRESAHDSCL